MLAAAVWGSNWKGENVMSFCDNAVVVAVLKGDCKEPHVMHLMRYLPFPKAKFQFSLFTSHVNGLADALSRAVLCITPFTGSTQPNLIATRIAGSDHNKETGLDIPSLD